MTGTKYHQPDYVTAGTPHCVTVVSQDEQGATVRNGPTTYWVPTGLLGDTPCGAIVARTRAGYRCPPCEHQEPHWGIYCAERKNCG